MFRRLATAGCLISLIPTLLVLAGLLVAGDIAAREYAVGQLNDRISAAVPEASAVHSRIRSFPFLGRLVVNGDIPEVGTHIDQLTVAAGIRFSDLDVDLRAVELDRHAMFFDHQIKLKKVNQGTFSVDFGEAAISGALGRPVHVADGAILVTVLGGTAVRASVAVTASHRLALTVAGLPALSVPLPSSKLLPCAPRIAVVTGAVHLGCTFTSIPPAFVQAATGTLG